MKIQSSEIKNVFLSTGCKPQGCFWNEETCGPFMLTEKHWYACGKPGSSKSYN